MRKKLQGKLRGWDQGSFQWRGSRGKGRHLSSLIAKERKPQECELGRFGGLAKKFHERFEVKRLEAACGEIFEKILPGE